MSLSPAADERREDVGAPSRLRRLFAGARCVIRPRRRPAYHVALDGMPEVRLARWPVAPREYIPWVWIYAPVVAKWFLLGFRHGSLTLPTLANPHIESGGFRGESKASYLRQIDADNQHWVARWTVVRLSGRAEVPERVRAAEAAMAQASLSYPVIVKPDIGACGYGVRLVADARELAAYIGEFPGGESLILQEFLPWAGEAGIFYIRRPGEERGRIYSLGLRYYPHVVGDGRASLRALIAADPRLARRAKLHMAAVESRLDEVPPEGVVVRLATIASLRIGALYRDGAALITRTLADRIDTIARSMPEFYYGRFDVRFASIEGLKRAEEFRVIEVNGAGAEAIHIWDPELGIGEAYRILFEQHEILFAIAARNRDRGWRPISLRELLALQWKESRLLRAYPVSN
ncbi:MAG TPA: hypothetical protein VFE11_01520 [Dongiaceae bacterium]|nr:hypothetical protein [Dongiaceae bacterium]